MTPTEQILEIYYRFVKRSFTITDWKVEHGNNRQFDILLYDPHEKVFKHVEISVTHSERWTANLDAIKREIGRKFFGLPKNKRPNNPNTDFNKGKRYDQSIRQAYASLGIDWEQVVRVWCLWKYDETPSQVDEWKQQLELEYRIPADKFELLSFRDEVLRSLYNSIGTSNYADEIMRTISLLKQFDSQTTRRANQN